jgi:circadian clock protein KaiB
MNANAALSPEANAMAAAVAMHVSAVCVLRLYIAGSSPRSARAISNIRKICDEYLQGCHELEVVDISQYPMLAKSEQILAAPTLIKMSPLPSRRFVGDMSQSERILLGLGLNDVPKRTLLAIEVGACRGNRRAADATRRSGGNPSRHSRW